MTDRTPRGRTKSLCRLIDSESNAILVSRSTKNYREEDLVGMACNTIINTLTETSRVERSLHVPSGLTRFSETRLPSFARRDCPRKSAQSEPIQAVELLTACSNTSVSF